MAIKGIENLSVEEINKELQDGTRFIVFEYCISILILTFRQSTDVYFIKRDESTLKRSFIPSFITFFLGWWGFPWGPIYSIGALFTNMKGGKDLTHEIVLSLKETKSFQDLKAPRRKAK